MAFSTTPTLGIDFTATYPSGTTAPFTPGVQVFGNDGKRYVFATAGATITASTAVCAINASTFSVAATGGAYTSPATALASGDKAWFSAASV